MALDGWGNLYVADGNNRVLEYDAPLSGGLAAGRVFGQLDFTHTTPNSGGLNASSLWGPIGLAIDAQGNLYVADSDNNRVLEYDAPLTSDGTADRVFGQPNFTSSTRNNGGVSANSLAQPQSVALDAAGNLYVADYGNSRVLEYGAPLTADATADRVLGQPDFSQNLPNNGGLGKQSLDGPTGVAVDAQGNLIVVDVHKSRALEYDAPLTTYQPADQVYGQGGSFTSGVSNNGGINADSLASPLSVALDGQGNLYVADTFNNRVLEYDVPIAHGSPVLTGLSPSAMAAGSPPFTLTVNGSVFYANSVVRWNGSNRPTTFLNSTRLNAAISPADLAGGGPFAVTVFTPTPGGGTSSLKNSTLYTRAGHDVMADMVQGQPNFAASDSNNLLMPNANQLNSPGGVAVDALSGRLFAADTDNHRVLSWPSAAALANGQAADLVMGQPDFTQHSANNGGVSAKSLRFANQAAVDRQGNLYVADSSNNRVLEYDAPLHSGMAASRVFGQGGSFTSALANNGGVSANSLNFPQGVALDRQGNLYVADLHNNRVLEYDTPLSHDTTADRAFGQPDLNSNTANNGGVNANSLNLPFGVALDAAGNLYVADHTNHRVLEYDAPLTTDRTADRVWGQPNFNASTANNGGVSAASLDDPNGVALDGWGNLYVADTGNNRVLEYDQPLTANRSADRVFGQPSTTSSAPNNGGLNANSLDGPQSVALDAPGNLYVADRNNNRVLEYDWALVKVALPLVRR